MLATNACLNANLVSSSSFIRLRLVFLSVFRCSSSTFWGSSGAAGGAGGVGGPGCDGSPSGKGLLVLGTSYV